MSVLLILDNDYPNTLAFMQSFKSAGIKIFVSVQSHKQAYYFSRYLSGVYKHGDTGYSGTGEIGDCSNFVEHIISCVLKNNIKVVLPISSLALLPILKYKNFIMEKTMAAIPFSSLDEILVCHDKGKFARFMAQTEYPHPKTYYPSTADDAMSCAHRLGYPLVVKPTRGRGADESSIVFNETQASTVLRRLQKRNRSFIMQEFIPGPSNDAPKEYNVSILMDDNQKVQAFFCLKRVRTYANYFGVHYLSCSTCFARVQERKQLIDMSISILKDLGWRGIADVQFRIDGRDNSPKILEINPRLAGTTPYAVACGVNFPLMLYQWALGQKTSLCRCAIKTKNYSVIHKDVLVIIKQLMFCKNKRRFIAQCISEYCQGIYCVDIDYSDPLPQTIFFFRRALEKTLKAISCCGVKINQIWKKYARFLFARNAKK